MVLKLYMSFFLQLEFFSFNVVIVGLVAAIANYHKLAGFTQQKCILSQC